jgi:hypothetical protein
MGAVSYVTERGNAVNVTDVIAAGVAPAFVKATCMMALMHTENLPVGTMTAKLTKKGSLTIAGALVEATALGLASGAELTDTSSDATIAKAAIVSAVSVESEQFGNINVARVSDEQGAAFGRYVDNDALGLFAGFSQSVTATALMTLDDIMTAQYTIFASECPNKEVALKAVLSHKGALNVRKELVTSGASIWTNPAFVEVLQGAPQNNCFIGSLLNIDCYQNSGHATSGGDTVQGVFHPMWALAGFFAPAPVITPIFKGSEGFYTEVAGYYFYDVLEWNDLAGVKVLSDT